MTQIKKTLSIAGIIAMVVAPAMADIASTAYVQSIVNNVIPTSGTVGDVLKKTESGVEWAAAPTAGVATASTAGLTKLYTDVGTNTDGTMTQAAIKTALGSKLDREISGNITIGSGAKISKGVSTAIAIGRGAEVTGDGGMAIGNNANAGLRGTVIGIYSSASADGATAVGHEAIVGEGAEDSIQLGRGTVTESSTLSVGLGYTDSNDDYISYPLLKGRGVIPAGRLVDQRYAEGDYFDDNGNNGDVLVSNGDGTMSWVDAADSVLPELTGDCKVSGQRCALITTWNSTTNKPEYTWEVVKVNNN